jgi:hypothetical protein
VDLPKAYPFTQLKACQGEQVLWYGYNPTFHRFVDYGLVLTNSALYLYRRNWWLIARWKRIPLDDVQQIEAIEGHARPGLRIVRTASTITFYTPSDSYCDEMEFDRKVLEKARAAFQAAMTGT